MDYRSELENMKYRFLVQKEHLGDRIVLLAVTGSNAYGTAIEGSDFDLRGICLEFSNEILGLTKFDRYVDNKTDTIIYGFNNAIKLLCEGDPVLIEVLGLSPEYILFTNSFGKQIIQNKELFITKKCYSNFKDCVVCDLQEIKDELCDKDKINNKAAHIIRLLSMGIEILNGEGVHTNRVGRPDYKMIMDVRRGKYTKNDKLDQDYYDYVADLMSKFDHAYQDSSLPEEVNKHSVEALMVNINLMNVSNKSDMTDEQSFMHFYWNNSHDVK